MFLSKIRESIVSAAGHCRLGEEQQKRNNRRENARSPSSHRSNVSTFAPIRIKQVLSQQHVDEAVHLPFCAIVSARAFARDTLAVFKCNPHYKLKMC